MITLIGSYLSRPLMPTTKSCHLLNVISLLHFVALIAPLKIILSSPFFPLFARLSLPFASSPFRLSITTTEKSWERLPRKQKRIKQGTQLPSFSTSFLEVNRGSRKSREISRMLDAPSAYRCLPISSLSVYERYRESLLCIRTSDYVTAPSEQ